MPEFTPWSPPPQSSPIQTLSGLLGVQQQQQALQTGQATQSSAQSAASIAGQTAKENQNLAKLIADPVGNGIANPDGTPTDKAADIYMAAAPTTWGQHYDNLVATAQRKVEFNNTVNNLKTNERAEVANTVAGAASGAQSPQDIKDAVANLVATKQGTPLAADYQKISGLVNAQLDHVTQATQGRNPMPPGQEPWRTAALNIGRSVLPASGTVGAGGIATGQLADINAGGVDYQGVRAPALQGGGFAAGSMVQNTLPPQMVTYPNKQLGQVGGGAGAITPMNSNYFTSAATPGGGAGRHAPPPGPPVPPPQSKLQPLQRPDRNAPAADQENYQHQIQGAGQEYSAVSQAANDPFNGVQATRFRNQQVIDLAPHANTGPGMKVLNAMASRLPGSSGDAYQDLEHYAAQNSAALAKLMGVPGTNMGQETAAAAAGNIERNPGALMEITKTNDAMNTAMDLYNRGLSKVTNNGSDMSKVPAYKQAFGQNIDVNALRWADAHRRGDKQEIQQLQQKAGPQGIAGYTQKLNTLKSLAATGDLS
jgi:hypothetical protein